MSRAAPRSCSSARLSRSSSRAIIGEYLGYWEQDPEFQQEGINQKCAPPPPMRPRNNSYDEEESCQKSAPPGAFRQPGPQAAYMQQAPQYGAYGQQPPMGAYGQQMSPGAFGSRAGSHSSSQQFGQGYPQQITIPTPEACPIQVKLFVQGVDYSSLQQDEATAAEFEATMKSTIADGRDIREEDVIVELSNGSVIVQAGMAAASGDHGALFTGLKASQGQLAQVATERVKQMPGIEAVQNGDIVVGVLEVKAGKNAGIIASPQRKKPAPQQQPPRASRRQPTGPQKPTNLDKSPQTGEMFIQAAKGGETSKLQKLLAMGGDPDAFGTSGPSGGTAIFYAAERGDEKTVQVLIDHMADANIPAKGMTPMQIAFQKGHKEILQKLFGATFKTLDTAVTQSGIQAPGMLPGGDFHAEPEDDECPASAHEQLKDQAKRIAGGNARAPAAREKENAAEDGLKVPSSSAVSFAQEAAIKGTLKNITKRVKY